MGKEFPCDRLGIINTLLGMTRHVELILLSKPGTLEKQTTMIITNNSACQHNILFRTHRCGIDRQTLREGINPEFDFFRYTPAESYLVYPKGCLDIFRKLDPTPYIVCNIHLYDKMRNPPEKRTISLEDAPLIDIFSFMRVKGVDTANACKKLSSVFKNINDIYKYRIFAKTGMSKSEIISLKTYYNKLIDIIIGVDIEYTFKDIMGDFESVYIIKNSPIRGPQIDQAVFETNTLLDSEGGDIWLNDARYQELSV